MKPLDDWLDAAQSTLAAVRSTQYEAVLEAAKVFAESIAAGGLVHVFGSGHSRMNVEEMFPRIGSYPGFHPIAELAITNHHAVVGPNGLRQAMYLEKVEGFARIILKQFKIHRGDCFLIFSSTGINGVVVDMAFLLRKMGIPVVAVTSFAHSDATGSRHSSGKKLKDLATIAIDNCSPAGDAAVDIDHIPFRIGPVSSIGAIAVVNSLKVATAVELTERGVIPVVLSSPHFTGSHTGEDQLECVYEEYFRRIGRIYDSEGAIPVPDPE